MILCSSAVRSKNSFEEAMAAISSAGFSDIDLLAINTWVHFNPADLVKDFEGIFANTEAVLKKNNLCMRAMNIGMNRTPPSPMTPPISYAWGILYRNASL